jgi:hypothetical protein
MKWSVSTRGSYFFIQLKRIIIFSSEKVRILGKVLSPILKRLLVSVGSVLRPTGKEITKHLEPLSQKQSGISDGNEIALDKERSIGFRILLRRLGIITAARLGETIRETKDAVKQDIEVSKQDSEGSELMPSENTIMRTNLNEELADRIRKQTGLDCKALEIGSLQIEHKRYYGNNFAMSPKITTNRGCIVVRGRKFSIIQVIQRN